MRIVAIRVREIAWTLDGRGAAAGRTERRGIVVEVRTDSGVTGYGEASPLPGMSRDTLDDARRELVDFVLSSLDTRASAIVALAPASSPPGLSRDTLADTVVTPADPAPSLEIDAIDEIFELSRRSSASPAARFAIETALLDALAQTRNTTIAHLFDPTAASIATSAVVDDAEAARAAVAAGARVLKIKMPDLAAACGYERRLAAVATAAPDRALRLDANRTWPRDGVRQRLDDVAKLAGCTGASIEFVEEPCIDAHLLLSEPEPLAFRIALDESLVDLAPEALDGALRSPSLAALVLKPTLLGGFAECFALAARARRAGVGTIVTHALESPIGAAACFELARVVGGPHAHGVRAPDPVASRPVLNSPISSPPASATADAESRIEPAAESVAVAVRRAAIHIATPTLSTIESIHVALDTRQPLALLHPGLSASELARQRAALDAAELRHDDALILFTSGSTGQARGVVLSRAAIVAAAEANAAHLGWRDDDRWLLALSTAHAGGAAVVARCHFAGKPIVLLDGWDRDRASAALERCTLASLVPTQLADLLGDPAWRPPRRLRAVLLGGAAASPTLLATAATRGVPFLATYGMTESFGQLATAPLDRAGDPATRLVPLRGVELVAGTRAVPAAIRVRAPMLATRYLDGTPIAPEYVTSDLGFVEGGLHVVGRIDDMIITGGENVSPATVEAVLAATPGVRAACAFAIPDEQWGQIVGAAIAAERLDKTAISAWRAALPAYACPRELAVVHQLPMLASGKLDRRAAARLPRERVRY